MEYNDFLKRKQIQVMDAGFEVPAGDINPQLFDFQKDIVRWALRKGRAAIFADCGLGKTPMQLEWARHVAAHTGGNVLIVAPLAVSSQTIREGEKFGVTVTAARDIDDIRSGINIVNYEIIHKFDLTLFAGIVLDESSILKSYSGKYRTELIERSRHLRYKLACTATPAPNDFMELGNHSEFLNVLTRTEMLSMFFVHDGGDTAKWRLKGHAEDKYWEWITEWAVMIRKPSDLGYDDGGFILPDIRFHDHVIEVNDPLDGQLFAMEAQSLTERRQARKETIGDRVALAAEIAAKADGPVLVWCNLNDESRALTAAIPGAVEITGSDSAQSKESAMLGFSDGSIRCLVTKPRIAGFGMNWQHCAKMIFVGLSDSYEEFYQAVRRCWRFGQTRPVDVDIVTASIEGAVVKNIKRKERDAIRMAENMVKHMQKLSTDKVHSGAHGGRSLYYTRHESGNGWDIYQGDCVEVSRNIEDESVHYSIFSPPFAELYTYSDSERDMGNARSYDEFFEHFEYLVRELYRITIPGRLVSFHCMDIPSMKERDGVIGLKDFPGDLVRAFQAAGWIYHGKHIIWKDPLIEATRTKALGLMHKQIQKDSAMCRSGLPDYLITMRKPGDNPEPVAHPHGFEDYIGSDRPETRGIKFSHETWRRYASPVWMDINQTNTLNKQPARGEKDEKHICPLQLDVIERGIILYSNPGDVVFTPFMGIGSEAYVALRTGRRAIGIELKGSYFNEALRNIRNAIQEESQINLLDQIERSA